MFSLNKTSEWLEGLGEKDKAKFLNKAREEGNVLRTNYLKRIKEIEICQKEKFKS